MTFGKIIWQASHFVLAAKGRTGTIGKPMKPKKASAKHAGGLICTKIMQTIQDVLNWCADVMQNGNTM
jgi:hypothetical protein